MPLVPPCKLVPPAQPHVEDMPAHAASFTVVVWQDWQKKHIAVYLGRPAADSKTFQTGTVSVTALKCRTSCMLVKCVHQPLHVTQGLQCTANIPCELVQEALLAPVQAAPPCLPTYHTAEIYGHPC